MSQLLANLNKVISDENVQNVNVAIKNVREASGRLDELSRDGSDAMKQLNATAHKADAAIENIRKVTEPLAGRADEITRNLAYTSGQLGLLMKDVRDLLRGYSGSDGTVQRLLTDPTLYNRINDTAFGLSRLMPKLELILDDLKDFSDQIARHPNRLIFDRGGGLKGSPFAPTAPMIGNSPLNRQGTGSTVMPRPR